MTDRSALLAQLGTDRIMAHHLREILHYDPESGIFTWLSHRSTGARCGDIAGCDNQQGYTMIGIRKKFYGAHRLAWLYMTGCWPDVTVDHTNRVRNDNRWHNLRLATQAQQSFNRSSYTTRNTSGAKGVTWKRAHNKWTARIRHQGRLIHLGYFSNLEDARSAYLNKARELFGEFAHGG